MHQRRSRQGLHYKITKMKDTMHMISNIEPRTHEFRSWHHVSDLEKHSHHLHQQQSTLLLYHLGPNLFLAITTTLYTLLNCQCQTHPPLEWMTTTTKWKLNYHSRGWTTIGWLEKNHLIVYDWVILGSYFYYFQGL